MGPAVPASLGLEEAQRSYGSSEDRQRMVRGGAPLLHLGRVFLGLGTRQCPGRAPGGQCVCTSFRGLAVAGNPPSITSKPEYTAGASYMLVARHCFSQINQHRSSSQSQGAWVRIWALCPRPTHPGTLAEHLPRPSHLWDSVWPPIEQLLCTNSL